MDIEELIMIRKMPLPPITESINQSMDDIGDSYDELVEETRRILLGTTEEVNEASKNSVQFRVLQGFVNRLRKGGDATAFFKKTTSIRSSCYVVEQQYKKTGLKIVFQRKPTTGNFVLVNRKPTQGSSASSFDQKPTTVVDQKKSLKLVLKRKLEHTDTDYDHHQYKSKIQKLRSNCSSGVRIMNLKTKKSKYTDLEISQEMPDSLSSEMEKRIEKKAGYDIRLMILKRLTVTDLKPQNARLSIPPNQLKDKDLTFLTDQEKSVVAIPNNTLPVMLMEPCNHESSLFLVKWSYDSAFSYMLRTGWNAVLRRKHFKANDVIQIWSFRVDGQLWLAIDKVRGAPLIEYPSEF